MTNKIRLPDYSQKRVIIAVGFDRWDDMVAACDAANLNTDRLPEKKDKDGILKENVALDSMAIRIEPYGEIGWADIRWYREHFTSEETDFYELDELCREQPEFDDLEALFLPAT